MGRFVDLSHPIENGMRAYPGLPSPVIEAHLTREASRTVYQGKAEFEISRVSMVGNTGTYLDSPYHRHAGREDVADLPLERIAGLRGVCLDAAVGPDGRTADASLPADVTLDGSAVLLRTGWDARWGSDAYWELGPFVGPTTLDALLAARVALVGVDFWNIDDTTDPARPVHTRLLDAGILIVEHLAGLGVLPRSGFRFTAVPAPLRGAATLPVRAYAELAT